MAFFRHLGYRRYADVAINLVYMELPASEVIRLAELVRTACIDAAKRGFDDAAISGLCHDGAVECAIGAIGAIDLDRLVESWQARNVDAR